jgi:hypothetical protein
MAAPQQTQIRMSKAEFKRRKFNRVIRRLL